MYEEVCMTLRNLPEDKPAELSNLIDVKAHQVVSMALSGRDRKSVGRERVC